MPNISTIFVTISNIFLLCCSLFVFFLSNNTTNESQFFNAGAARIAVRDQLDVVAAIPSESGVKINQSCVEVSGSKAIAVGQGNATVEENIIDGIFVDETTSFTYQADITSNCSYYNINCYSVDRMKINGTRKFTPSL
jgi:hypothetical protein